MNKIALLLLAAPLALAACGGSSNAQVKVDPVAYVRHAAHATAATRSEHMELTAKLHYGGAGDGSVTAVGDFSNSPLQGALTLMFFAPSGHVLSLHEIVYRSTAYVNADSPKFTANLPSGKAWVKGDIAQINKAMSGADFSESPEERLKQLEADGEVTEVGAERIDGVATTHFRIENIDLSKLPQGAKLAEEKIHIDVWIGNDSGYVYRETRSVTFVADGQSDSQSTTVDFSHFGEALHVKPPPASVTVNLSKTRSGGLGL